MNSRRHLRSNQDLFALPVPHILTDKRTGGVFAKPQALLSIWSHKLAESSSNIGVGVDGFERKILVSTSCIDEIAVGQPEFPAIIGAETGILAEGTIVQFSIILRFAVCHSENDLRAAIVPNNDIELMAIGYTSVKVTQLPSFTLSSERN